MVTIPKISELYNGILSDLEAEFGVNIPTVGKNFLRVIAAVQAAKLKLFYLSLGNLQKNIFVDTADRESLGGTLERFGRVKLGRNPFPAIAAQYQLEVTGSVDAVIPASTTFKSNDNSKSPGKLYVLDSSYTLLAETDNITVRALESGLDSSLNELDELTATAPIAGVNSVVSVASTVVEPQAAESIEDYRSKIIDSFRLEPQGGAPVDYRLWASVVQGVAQTYPYAKSGASGEINLFIEATVADSTDGKGTPSPTLLEAVEDALENTPPSKVPLNVVKVNYLPVTVKEVEIQVSGFVGYTTAIEDLITDTLEQEFSRIRPFVGGIDTLSEKNNILDKNKIISIILSARPGSIFNSNISLIVDGVSVDSYTFEDGSIPHLSLFNHA